MAKQIQNIADILDLFVDNHSNSTLRNIKNSASSAMVCFVWHSLVNGSIRLEKSLYKKLNNASILIGSYVQINQRTDAQMTS